MGLFRRALALAATVAVPAALLAAPAGAARGGAAGAAGAVYVLGNEASGNAVLVYDRSADGTLSGPVSYPTGGLGTGGGLGSQGAVILDGPGRHLYAVNAGSSEISSFRVRPDGLELVDVVGSGGVMPTSLTVHGDVLYVLNAGGSGNIAGFTIEGGELEPIAGGVRPLSNGGSGASPAPAQVSFSPDGSHLVVTERATDVLDVFAVDRDGVATGPVVVPSAGATPFGFEFDRRGHAVVSEAFGGAADASAVSSYDLADNTLHEVSASVPTTETAACWIAITGNGKYAFAGNAGADASSVTGYRIDHDGSLAILDADGKTGTATGGVTDLAVSRNSRFLYGRISDGTVAVWSIAVDGSLAALPSAAGLPAGAAGIAAA